MISTTLTPGTPVVYFGSIDHCHGPATVVGACGCQGCRGLNRLVLVTAGTEMLQHVRAESVAVLRWAELPTQRVPAGRHRWPFGGAAA